MVGERQTWNDSHYVEQKKPESQLCNLHTLVVEGDRLPGRPNVSFWNRIRDAVVIENRLSAKEAVLGASIQPTRGGMPNGKNPVLLQF